MTTEAYKKLMGRNRDATEKIGKIVGVTLTLSMQLEIGDVLERYGAAMLEHYGYIKEAREVERCVDMSLGAMEYD